MLCHLNSKQYHSGVGVVSGRQSGTKLNSTIHVIENLSTRNFLLVIPESVEVINSTDSGYTWKCINYVRLFCVVLFYALL